MQFGSGSALLGGTDALNAAVAARQTGQAGTTQQVSAAAPPSPTVLPGQPGMTNAGSGPIGTSLTGGGEEGMGMQPLTNAGQAPATSIAPFDPAEVKIILSAMGGRMKSISRLQGDIKG